MKFYKFSKNCHHVYRRSRYNHEFFRFTLNKHFCLFFRHNESKFKSKFDEKLKNYVKTLNEKQNQIKIRIDKRLKIVIKFQK